MISLLLVISPESVLVMSSWKLWRRVEVRIRARVVSIAVSLSSSALSGNFNFIFDVDVVVAPELEFAFLLFSTANGFKNFVEVPSWVKVEVGV